MADAVKLRELMERARGNRLKTLQLMPDKAQTWRIAKRLGIPPARAQLHAQWAKRNGLATWARSRWDLTPLGRALIEAWNTRTRPNTQTEQERP